MPGKRTRVTVLAPDEVTEVTVTQMDGSTSTLHFKNNVATDVYEHSARSLAWVDDQGVPHQQCMGGRRPPLCGQGAGRSKH
jgi:hypothetical protein